MKRPIFFAAVLGAVLLCHSEAAVERELHVVGVYQGAGHITGQNNQGTATIHVDRPEKQITLFLSSYDPIRWQVTAGVGTVVERVFLDGYHDQVVEGLPEGTPVVETTYEGGGAYLWVGYSLDDPRTLGSIPLIEQRTGMTISSFHGTYEAPAEAIVIDAIQNDPRLASSWPQPLPPDELPSVSFNLAFLASVGVEIRNYTLQGPVDGGTLIPGDDDEILSPDSEGRVYYGSDSDPFRFDTMIGVIDTLPIPQTLPELSWPRGITFDTHRDRAVLVSLGGEGFLYAFSAGSRDWSLISSMDQRDADSIAYHAPDDSLYVVLNSYSTIHPPILRLSSEDGSELGRIRLPTLPFDIGSGARSEIVSVGEFLVLLLSHKPYNSVSPPRDERIYLIDPRTGEVKLTWRRIGEPPPPPKVPAFPSQTEIDITRVPPPFNVDAARPWWGATVRLTFDHPLAEVTKWGELIRDGNSFAVDVEAVQPSGAVPLPPRTVTFDRTFVLGGLPSGDYNFRVTSRGRTLREKTFTIPLEPPGGEIIADVALSVDSRDPGHVTAKAHIEFGGYYVVTGQSPVSRDALGRFVLEATVEHGFIIQVFPPPPFPVENLSYNLGEVPPGRHTAIFKMNGRTFATKDFVVGDPRPPVNAQVSARFETIAEGTIAHVRIHLPNDFFIMSDPGEPVIDGRVVSIDATFSRNPHPSPLAVTKVINHDYHLGLLAAGDYRFVYRINGDAKLEQPFSVEQPPPPPGHASLAFIAIKHGDSSTAAEVGLSVPDFKFVSDWGEVRVDGNRFKVSVTLGNAPIPVPVGFDPVADPPRHIERHVYSLGVVDPGDYVLAVFEGTRFLGERAFRVGPKPPPPPPPLPLVAFIRHGVDATGSFVEVGLAFSRPRLMVKDWGISIREGNRFKVNIEIGEAVLPPIPLEPPADGTPVFITTPDNSSPGLVPESELERFGEIGGWPGFIVRHRYPLGALTNGEYVFVVCLGGDEAARHAFRVGEPGTPGPMISVEADDIVNFTSEPHSFTVHYHATFGTASNVMSRKVIVTGPHGFSAEAKPLACYAPLDGSWSVISCLYEVEGPGGDWDAADNGRYTVCVEPALVIAGNDRPLPGACAFGWQVDIEPDPPPHLPATVTVSMRDGRWFADVRFENTGGWFAADWGEVRLFGPVFSAFAQLHNLPERSLAPIPVSFEHTYSLGELRPGRYRFVFRSNRGHCGSASINVPGIEPPTPLAQWKLNRLGPGAGADDSDSDGDGLPLFGEYYLGCDPTRHDAPEITPSLIRGAEGRWHAALGFRHISDGDASLRCVIQASDDMINWRDCGEEIELTTGGPAIDGTRENSARHRLPLPHGGRIFMRLRMLHGAD